MDDLIIKKIDELVNEYSAEDTGLLLIGKYDHNLLKTALHRVASYVKDIYERAKTDKEKQTTPIQK